MKSSQHYKAEQVLEIECPRCQAPASRFCNRAGERLSKEGQRLRAERTPPSHRERLWARQGHDGSKFDQLRHRDCIPGKYQARGPGCRGGGRVSGYRITGGSPGTSYGSGYGL
jgi:hypothetical protein